MLRTIIICIFVVFLGWSAASWITRDFQIWTEEGARRLAVTLQPVELPTVLVEGPTLAKTELSTLLSQKNNVTIVNFIYTRCRAICLSLGNIFQQLQSILISTTDDEAANVRLLSISFDSEHDDLSALQSYADNLGAQPEFWRFIRVSHAKQEQALLQRLGVVVIPDGNGDYEHNAALLIFDGTGCMVRIFDIEEYQLALDYALHLAKKQALESSS